MSGWEMVVGVEVHVQLKTRTKMFCACANRFGAPPNSLVCPICSGMPGSLPSVNMRAVELGIAAGLALGCAIAEKTSFDRKNYFYPDMPKGYQITQYDRPLASRGRFRFPLEGGFMEAGITRAHLEEDSGKNVHDAAARGSFVDLNRAGVPLVEIVTDPDFRTPGQVSAYLAALKQLLQYIGVSDCNMEQGSLRCEPNVSIRRAGEKALGTKTEIKNVNSFKSVEKALRCEFERQRRILESGGRVIQETLLWNDAESATEPMRGKEEARDYRYFPEPDLPPLEIPGEWVERTLASMPERPEARRARLIRSFGLKEYDAALLTASREFADFFESCAALFGNVRRLSSLFMVDLLAVLDEEKTSLAGSRLNPAAVAGLLSLEEEGEINKNQVKEILAELVRAGGDPAEIARRRGMAQVRDQGEIGSVVARIVAENPESVADYREFRENMAVGLLIGRIIRAMGGGANPQAARALLEKELKSRT